ncbi:hypothetical protein SAMN05877809_10339 [Rhodobacter sp. JA431]|uniref:PGN_0703 family putative restriction endonuclease n=1 Tax=Rhodobacter sp. JA431 TaxID=570013 RepID=UPI000BDA793D|nr:hypothetical protein [Rhodobacter sp. JA431]SOC03694.1 hypothetical protein SAMN05877809_10339 [Rhodobacter sp. JA431]
MLKSSIRSRAITALCTAHARAHPGVDLDEKGYAPDWRGNLLPAVCANDVAQELSEGSGQELATKFRAAHSSSALAVNVFAPFKRAPEVLHILDRAGFTQVAFEKKCPTGLGGTPPNLDVMLDAPDGLIAIESKCLEYLTPKTAKFADSYRSDLPASGRESTWFAEMLRLCDDPKRYHHLDAAQLVKHSLGLAHSYPDRTVTLLYLFWEPTNATEVEVFSQHRAEIERFAEAVTGDRIAFRAMSYPELWLTCGEKQAPRWCVEHLAELRRRYLVAI